MRKYLVGLNWQTWGLHADCIKPCVGTSVLVNGQHESMFIFQAWIILEAKKRLGIAMVESVAFIGVKFGFLRGDCKPYPHNVYFRNIFLRN